MTDKTGPYQVVDLSPGRRMWLNTLELSWTPHAMYGLLEVDVTVARQVHRRAQRAHRREPVLHRLPGLSAWPAPWMRTRRCRPT